MSSYCMLYLIEERFPEFSLIDNTVQTFLVSMRLFNNSIRQIKISRCMEAMKTCWQITHGYSKTWKRITFKKYVPTMWSKNMFQQCFPKLCSNNLFKNVFQKCVSTMSSKNVFQQCVQAPCSKNVFLKCAPTMPTFFLFQSRSTSSQNWKRRWDVNIFFFLSLST